VTHWSPNLFRIEGISKGYNQKYLNALIQQGETCINNQMPVVFSLAHLANLSNTLYADLHDYVSRANINLTDYPYKNFTISKRTGGKRWISIPVPPLMAVQKWINQNILNHVTPHPSAFAYAPKRKIIDHAKRHCGASWLLKIDIKDFFNNISERQVFDVFLNLGYPKLLSFEMARLCTRATPKRKGSRWVQKIENHTIPEYSSKFIGSLPQGAPTSPALSNLVCINLDNELAKLANSRSATYSRYADDLCFSFVDSSRNLIFEIKREVSKILWRYGFSENLKKTRIIPPGARKILTGLNVNSQAPTIPKEVRDLIRMHLYHAKKQGIPNHCKARKFRSVIGFRNHLFGLIGYVESIDKRNGEILRNQFNELPWLDFDI